MSGKTMDMTEMCECEQERAAILEHEAGMHRELAEEEALNHSEPYCNACPKRITPEW